MDQEIFFSLVRTGDLATFYPLCPSKLATQRENGSNTSNATRTFRSCYLQQEEH